MFTTSLQVLALVLLVVMMMVEKVLRASQAVVEVTQSDESADADECKDFLS